MVVGVALVGGGVVRSVLRWRRQSVSAQLTPGGGAIVWGGEF